MRATPKRVDVQALDGKGAVEVTDDGVALTLRFMDAMGNPHEARITRSTGVAISDALDVFALKR
jgi:hypothetical protein